VDGQDPRAVAAYVGSLQAMCEWLAETHIETREVSPAFAIGIYDGRFCDSVTRMEVEDWLFAAQEAVKK
jgi:hypothetical protein